MDLRRLGAFIAKHIWVIVLVTMLVEALIAGLTMLVSEQYQARSLVRLGRVEGADVGAQGAVVEQVQMELEEQAQVRVFPRPNSIVLVTAAGPTATEAVAMAQDATRRLIERSKAAVELTLRERRVTVDALKTSIKDVDVHVQALTKRETEGPRSPNSFVQYTTAAQLKELFDLRTNLQRQLQQAEIDLIRNVTEPVVLWEVKTPAEPFRPRWGRNLTIGGVFGLGFGIFLVVLMGVLHEVTRNQHSVIQVR